MTRSIESGGPGGRSRLPHLPLLMGVAAIVLLTATGAAVAKGSGTTAQAAPQTPPGGVIRHWKLLAAVMS